MENGGAAPAIAQSNEKFNECEDKEDGLERNKGGTRRGSEDGRAKDMKKIWSYAKKMRLDGE